MKKIVFVVLSSAMLAFAAPALANSPTNGTYSGTGATQVSQAQGTTDSATASQSPTTSTTSASTLPFTGLNVGTVAIVAMLLVGSGFVLRRRAGSEPS